MFESGAILIYLADKTGRLLPPPEDYLKRMDAIQWLMFQMGGVGPFFGQTHHFNRFAKEKIPYAIERYVTETKRLYGVMDRRLAEVAYLGGRRLFDRRRRDLALGRRASSGTGSTTGCDDYPNVVRWYDAIRARPAVQRGYDVPPSDNEIPARVSRLDASGRCAGSRRRLRERGSRAEVIELATTARSAQDAARCARGRARRDRQVAPVHDRRRAGDGAGRGRPALRHAGAAPGVRPQRSRAARRCRPGARRSPAS